MMGSFFDKKVDYFYNLKLSDLSDFDFNEKSEYDKSLPVQELINAFDLLNISSDVLFNIIKKSNTYHQNDLGLDILMSLLSINSNPLKEDQFCWLVENSNLKNKGFNFSFSGRKVNAFQLLLKNKLIKPYLGYFDSNNHKNQQMCLSENVVEYFIEHSDLDISDNANKNCSMLLIEENEDFKNPVSSSLIKKALLKSNLNKKEKDLGHTLVHSAINNKNFHDFEEDFLLELIEKSNCFNQVFFNNHILDNLNNTFSYKNNSFLFKKAYKRPLEDLDKILCYISSNDKTDVMENYEFFKCFQDKDKDILDEIHKGSRFTPLTLAIQKSDYNMYYGLLYLGCDMYKRDKDKCSPESLCLEHMSDKIEQIHKKARACIEHEKMKDYLPKNKTKNYIKSKL